MLAWFNPEEPEILAVTDMDRKNPFCVERSQPVPALGASNEDLARESQRCGEHMSFAKTRYRVLRAKYDQEFRPNLVTPAAVRLGQEMEVQRSEVQGRQQSRAKAQRVYGRLGMALPNGGECSPEQIAVGEKLYEKLNKPRNQEGDE